MLLGACDLAIYNRAFSEDEMRQLYGNLAIAWQPQPELGAAVEVIGVSLAWTAGDGAAEAQLARRIGVPVTVEYVARDQVLDRSALFRGPKIYKPSVISDWRTAGRKSITIMEALLEWPRFDASTLFHLARRQILNARRRRRILREDRNEK